MEEMVEEIMFVVKYSCIIFLNSGKTGPIANYLEVNSVRFYHVIQKEKVKDVYLGRYIELESKQ